MASNECNSTSDCLDVGSGVPRVCYHQVSFSDRENFCDCASWYGWTGEECDVAGAHTWYTTIVLFIFTIWASILILLTTRTLSYHVRFSLLKGNKPNPVFYTGLMIVLGGVLVLIFTSITLRAMFDSTKFQVSVFDDFLMGAFEEVTAEGEKAATFSLFGLATVYFLLSAQIILSWYSLVAQVAKFYPELMLVSAEKMQKIIKGFTVFEVILSITLVATDSVLALFINAAILGILMLFLYITGGQKFISACEKSFGEEDESTRNAMKLVSRCSWIHKAFLSFGVIMMVIYGILTITVVDDIEPGRVNIVKFCRDIIPTMCLALLTFDGWYVHSVSKNLLKLNKNVHWIPQFSLLSSYKLTTDTNQITKMNSTSEGTMAISNQKIMPQPEEI